MVWTKTVDLEIGEHKSWITQNRGMKTGFKLWLLFICLCGKFNSVPCRWLRLACDRN